MAVEPRLKSDILAILPAAEDRAFLSGICSGSDWQLHAVATLAEARPLLERGSPGAILCECVFPDGQSWKDLLVMAGNMAQPSPLIVAHRLADERLWAEVLNLGGYDLLAKPFDRNEVLRTLGAACRWHSNEQRAIVANKLSRIPERNLPAAPERRMACGGSR